MICTVFLQVNEGTNVVLQHNIVAGYERVAYRINGEPCPGNGNYLYIVWYFSSIFHAVSFRTVKESCEVFNKVSDWGKRYRTEVLKDFSSSMTSACAGYLNENENWIHNEAHGGLYGVYLNKDGLPGCSLIQGFFIWRSFDYGIYFQVLNFFCFSWFRCLIHPQNNVMT